MSSERERRFGDIAATVTEPVRRFLRRRVDADTADDVLADTLLVCWRRLDEVPAGPEALPWAYAVARHALANVERSSRRQRRLAHRITVMDPPTETIPFDEEADPRVAEALKRLRPDQAELLRLWAWEQLGAAEIATVLHISANAASIRLHRAKGKFKEIWADLKDQAE
ncbi:RNA polymerase sigma factor [Nocardioides sp.]|uniref:RNA polymerase sigma factor n=1 Tax=Nocardioides sp. TaxID=35761 RepID=UPI003568F1F9